MKCSNCEFEAKNERGMKIHASKHKVADIEGRTVMGGEAKNESMVEGKPTSEPPSVESELMTRIAELERQNAESLRHNAESQKMIKMLYETADKGRIFNWESKQKGAGQGRLVKLSVIDGKILVGWRTVRDELIHDPKTGRTAGEFQQYELLLYGDDGQHTARIVDGYLNFSNLRYENRIDCQVLSSAESYDGKVTFEVGLPDGRKAQLDSRFVN